jgi:TonB family protein
MHQILATLLGLWCVCIWSLAQAQLETGKVFQYHDGQEFLVVNCHQLDECFEAAYRYCKGAYQSLDQIPSSIAFRFECKPANKLGASPGKGFPKAEDYYPSASRRLGEEGMPVVKVCLDPDGKLTEPPTIDKTSGFPSLDAAAIRLATDANGHYNPATSDGKPVAACTNLGIRFTQ